MSAVTRDLLVYLFLSLTFLSSSYDKEGGYMSMLSWHFSLVLKCKDLENCCIGGEEGLRQASPHANTKYVSVQFAEFDELMRGDPEHLKFLVSRVQRWLVCKKWKKVIYGAISVQKCKD